VEATQPPKKLPQKKLKRERERELKAAQVGDLTSKAQAVHHPILRAPTTLHPTLTRTPTQVMKMSKMVMIRQRRRKEENKG
jgi:hypothetical protein